MSDWRAAVLARFGGGTARVWLAVDPDGLLGDPAVVDALRTRGFEVCNEQDPVALRVAWASSWVPAWRAGDDTARVLVLPSHEALAKVPFDMGVRAQTVVLARTALFPEVPVRAWEGLPPAALDDLDRARRDAAQRVPSWAPVVALHDAVRAAKTSLRAAIPDYGAPWSTWSGFAAGWAQFLVTLHDGDASMRGDSDVQALWDDVEARFARWMEGHHDALANASPTAPVMVHHVPRAMARAREERVGRRIALLVMDGMSYDQWLVLEPHVSSRMMWSARGIDAVAAWVPTTTAVSRHALFAGVVPRNLGEALGGVGRERRSWETYWAGEGLDASAVGYRVGLGDGSLDEVATLVLDARVQVVGLVVDKIDRIMHGMELGTAGMHDQLRRWARGGWLDALLRLLHQGGFDVFVTADHGNVEAVGVGRPRDGALAEVRGERMRMFDDADLAALVRDHGTMGRPWQSRGGPLGRHVLLAPGRTAFLPEGHRAVVHGGIALEEVAVPLVRLFG